VQQRKLVDRLAITFVLPVLNETDSLRTTVETITRLAAGHTLEVLVITADRTTDASMHVVGELQQEHPDLIRIHRQQLPRLGGAMRDAFELATGAHVMLMASDLETDPELIPQFIEKMQEGCWDIVSGSRWLPQGGFEGYGRLRKLLNRLFQCALRLLYPVRLTDLTFAYRLYRREVLQGIHWVELGHPFLLECLLKPLRLGARVVEVPCRWRCRSEGESAGSFRQMFSYVPLAVRVRLLRKKRIRSVPTTPA
jgi:glycosyltransferase involved in cell wall biosynthesis